MPFNWEVNQQNAAHTYNRTPSNSKKEQTADTESNMDEPLMHYTKRRKPDGKEYPQYMLYMYEGISQ